MRVVCVVMATNSKDNASCLYPVCSGQLVSRLFIESIQILCSWEIEIVQHWSATSSTVSCVSLRKIYRLNASMVEGTTVRYRCVYYIPSPTGSDTNQHIIISWHLIICNFAHLGSHSSSMMPQCVTTDKCNTRMWTGKCLLPLGYMKDARLPVLHTPVQCFRLFCEYTGMTEGALSSMLAMQYHISIKRV